MRNQYKPYTVLLHFDNGFVNDRSRFASYIDAVTFCRTCVSRTGHVRRIEIRDSANVHHPRAMWDRSWDAVSNLAGLRLHI